MAKLNLDEIAPGMVLDDDVKDLNGRILLKKGVELTEKHLTIFKMWGVTEANISGVDREEISSKVVEDIDPALLEEAEAAVAQLFSQTDLQHPVVKELFRLSLLKRVRQTGQGASS